MPEPLPHPGATVVAPCRNEAGHLAPFLDSLLAQQTTFPFEVIIADGMSDDGTDSLLRDYQARFPALKVIANPGLIVSTGLNAAIRMAEGAIIVRMDVHTEYAPDYLERCVRLLESRPDVANVGGPARTRARGYLQCANQLAYHSPFSVGGAAFHDMDYEGFVDTVPYGCWRKDDLLRLGLFDEELVRNQDDELNLRIHRAGGRVWQCPEIRSWYHPRATLQSIFKQYMQYGFWKVRVIRKHRMPHSLRHLVPGAFVGVAGLLGLASLASPVARWGLAGLLGSYGAFLGLGAVLACRGGNWRYLPVLPLVFSAYHLGYGYGFLRGLLDALFNAGAAKGFSRITRGN